MAGAIAELARHSITRDFRSITPHCARIILVEAGGRLLPTMPEKLSHKAARSLSELGVDVRLNAPVNDINAESVTFGGTTLSTNTVIWAAGVRASEAGHWLDAMVDRAGRVIVGEDFSLPGHPEIFVAGDTAGFRQEDGKFLPGIAPAAKQAGAYVGQLIKARVEDSQLPKPFRFADFGNMATIGRRRAVADLGFVRLSGLPGWLLWSLAHVYFLIGFRNRLSVALNWAWSYVTYQRGVRLITGSASGDIPVREAA
jgi:NADH dehydrogenase